ncbi:MAG: PAS domain S-box protein, partial [Candidatus Kryptoniota bacterium]
LMWGYYGIHDMAILAFPAVIVIAALTLDKKYFILFSLTSLFTIGLEGYLEIIGILKFSNYPETTSVTLTNTLVILSITAVVVRLISSNFNKSLVAARNAEKEIRSQFDQLQVWNKRYRSLFEVANDAIFIMDEGRFVECNSRALGMFGCDNRSEIVGHSPWDFSPARQPGGGDSEREARNLIQAALSGKPQRFYWKHIQKDGTPFDAEVSLSAIDLSNKYLQVLVRDISERRQGELLQNAIYMISQAADKSANLNDLYKAVHEIVGTVMPASNFYIALYDERADIVSFPYFVDEIDSFCSPHKFGKGLTEYVIRTGKSFLCDEAADKELTARGEIELIGPPSVVWIGVPLVVDYKTIGVMVAQHYTNTKAYGERELKMLEYVSEQVAKAIERKRKEEALKESEERFRALIENSSDGIALLNANFENIYRSPSRKHILGYNENESLNAFETIHDDDLPSVRKALEQIASVPGATATLEVRLRHKNGSWIIVEATGKNLLADAVVKGIVINYRDVTERKQAEETFRLQSAALQSAANAIVITDKTGTIKFVNRAFTVLTGYATDEALGANPRILKSGRNDPLLYQGLWTTIMSGSVWQGQLINKRKDGSFYDEEMTVTPVRNSSFEIDHFVAIKNDITERKRLQEQLVQSQKMESIGTLAAGIAHDFNNIIGIILGHSSLMSTVGTADKNITKGVAAIMKAAERGSSLVHQLLTFARKNGAAFTSTSINDSIKEIEKLFHETFPKTMTLAWDKQENLPSIIADSTQIHQVMLNLCLNARDAMDGVGILKISTQVVVGETVHKRFPDATYAEYIVVNMSDTGSGMDDETMSHIFEPFFTTKESGKGTGLGLAVVFGIMKDHHGFVDVKSEKGQGTTFSLFFPVRQDTGERLAAMKEHTKDVEGGKETILVVEDEEMLKELAFLILSSKGYAVITASDGKEAVQVYRAHSDEVSLVFSDFGLPNHTGIEVLRLMKAINPEVKFILASGYIDANDKSEILQAGAKDVISKPYTPE